MILTGEEIKNRKIIENVLSNIQYQQSGFDLTLGALYKFSSPGKIDFSNAERKISEAEQLTFHDDEIFLNPGAYKIKYNEYVKVPVDCAGILLPRSSLLRSGTTISGALWDPGYEGMGESLLQVLNPNGIILKKNARVAQIIFIKLTKDTTPYNGVYKYEGKNDGKK